MTAAALLPLLPLPLAFALDALAGEYPNRLHPVVWMGKTIGALERLAPSRGRAAQVAWGAAVAALVPAAFAAAAWGLLALLGPWPLAALAAEVLLLKATFALRALGAAAADVRAALERGDLPSARCGLRSLCSRDPSSLSGAQVAAAAVESVAENLSDSLVAPLFWYAVAGLPGAVAYRAINTLDASIGYRGRYEWLGKASARLDDLANLVPARLTAALLLVAGALVGGRPREGLRVLLRDGGRTESPNAGRPMAAMAGLLGVELEKLDHYRLGDPSVPVDAATIARAWVVTRAAAAMAVLLALLPLLLRGAPHVA
ncbi:MAG TPA: adenosylcobinamide-phosphate synthase CbiB [Anaeromyxobacteraceae bacterium]|nr:adenosylcobinamide-phosphate synthase CbiB [Anaeromyxobacteraceae bacterium]